MLSPRKWLGLCTVLLLGWIPFSIAAKTHRFNFTTGYVLANPDGTHERYMIGFNGEWPVPDIHVNKGDRVELYLTNGFDDGSETSLHFHGLFLNSSHGNLNQMDGPSMVTQCPIMPGQTYLYNFTVPDQVGTYWYHAHSASQYGDGMRGAFIIHDDNEPFEYDEEKVITLSDYYHEPAHDISKEFLSRYNPTGVEPIPQNLLFNNTVNVTLDFTPGKTYLLRFINGGLFVSQYLAIEDHKFTIVEVDGVYIQPNTTDLLYIASGQRMSVLVKAKETDPGKNFAFMQLMDEMMLDVVPPDLVLNRTNIVSYSKNYKAPDEFYIDDFQKATNDFYLTPLQDVELYNDYDYQVTLDVRMKNLGDGVKYAFFNDISYVAPKVPTLTTVLTGGNRVTDARIYGDNINAYVIESGDIVEIVLNNYDPGKHPFHIHGHNFQIVQKSPSYHEEQDYTEDQQDEITVPYDEDAPLMEFPEHPMMRDTVVLPPNGHVVLRFKADNPGVWIFHCHVNWHLEQGLAAVFIEDPLALQHRETLGPNYLDICSSAGISNVGNAAGNSDDWLDMKGLPRQPPPLPAGFTMKGYIAFFMSTAVGIWGLYSIAAYGMLDTVPNDQEVYSTLKQVLESNNIPH